MRALRAVALLTIAACGAEVAATGDGGPGITPPVDGAPPDTMVDGGLDEGAFDTGLDVHDATDGGRDGGAADAPIGDAADADVDAPDGAGMDADAAPPCVFGTSVYTDIYAGQPANSGMRPSAVIDAVNGKLLVATDNQANGGTPALFRCNLDGTACSYADISTGQLAKGSPSAVIDVANAKILVVSNVAGKPGLFRCNLDGTGCAFADISAGRGSGSGTSPSAVFDAANDKLLVATTDGTNQTCRPAIFRCNADGSGCVYTTPPDQGCATGPSATIDVANGKLLVATSNTRSWMRRTSFAALSMARAASTRRWEWGPGVPLAHRARSMVRMASCSWRARTSSIRRRPRWSVATSMVRDAS